MGEVPRYLREMKQKTQEQQRLVSEIDVNCPPGHVGLSENERQEALEFANLSKSLSFNIRKSRNTYVSNLIVQNSRR